ncbi:hypothetical protein [Cellvibrio sp. KY-GH-1]|uniref:beta family protein n=1 Tax=Cellvibrio sp. KY-GH-1 TaxID=2303332 RepID=UPI001780B3FE|nr:hypothetical protein [Cellvibrio sp. KY-GH-1]
MGIKGVELRKYIPIIKWQKNERLALSFLEEDIKQCVLPCLEIRNHDQHTKLLECFEEVWDAPAIIDYANPQGVLTVERIRELREFLKYARDNEHPIVPALNPMDALVYSNTNLIKAISKHEEIALRLRVSDFKITDANIANCKKADELFAGKNKRLIVDFGNSPQEKDAVNLNDLDLNLKKLRSEGFKNIHIISGAFPSDLSSVKNGPKNFIRYDLEFWKNIQSRHSRGPLGYGDYGILSPGWTEETLQRRGSRVAIRYTCEGSWFILRGANAKKSESIALSELLLNVYEDVFKGADYSWGDKIIADRANQELKDKDKKSGGYHFAEAWNHHITFVIKELIKKTP